MGIDWFTFVAQIVNFLILVALLRHFLYRPIIEAMDQREETIESRLREAEEKKKEAEQKAEDLHQQQAELEQRREKRIAEAKEEAESQRKQLLSEARKEAENAKARWQEAIEQEKESFLEELRETVAHQTSDGIRKILADLADADLEGQIIEKFLDRLKAMDQETRDEIAKAVTDKDGPITVRSAFEIPEKAAGKIQEAIKEQFSTDIGIKFETARELYCGVELRVAGRKLGWNFEDHVRKLEEGFLRVFEEQGGSREGEQGSQEEKEEKEEDEEAEEEQ